MKTNNCAVLNENILEVFEFLAKFSTRLFCKFFNAVDYTLMKKLNKFGSKAIVPAAVTYRDICFNFIQTF